MNRNTTNIIRFLMDECLPPIVRDSKLFMAPFYYFAYRGKCVEQAMDFKKLSHSMSSEEYADFYSKIDTISRNRPTDLNIQCLNYILSFVSAIKTGNLVDIGCAGGFLLKKMHEVNSRLTLHGYDIKNFDLPKYIISHNGDVSNLPYSDKQFDVVTCCHTLEHLIKIKDCVSEIVRIAKKEIIIVTPCQRPYYYTLDEHVNFFFYAEQITSLFEIQNYKCFKLGGDWIYHASIG